MRGLCPPFIVLVTALTYALAEESTSEGLSSAAQKWWHDWQDSLRPSLITDEVNVTAIVGQDVALLCHVKNLNRRMLSWIRSRDLTVLAVGRHVVTSDVRFSVKNPDETEDWFLEIKDVKIEDDGMYDCQINTHPKLSTRISLRVVSDKRHFAAIEENGGIYGIGPTILNIEEGGNVHLLCMAHFKPSVEKTVVWTLNDTLLNAIYSLDKVKMQETWRSSSELESEMILSNALARDSGEYSCRISSHGGENASFSVHIFQEGQPQGAPAASRKVIANSAPTDHTALVTGIIIVILVLFNSAICFVCRKAV